MGSSEGLIRIPTGIIDGVIQGGIPLGSTVLVKGCPKSGKSVFISQIAYNQVKSGTPVIGILADDSKEDFFNIHPRTWNGLFRISGEDPADRHILPAPQALFFAQ
ncbi:MAG: hypothetical protein J7K57_02140 [Palaeococcus sp.]|uniref:RAD55 family ATPase n=1 Tax=Palaeococcus sp. (in: euryarchaeotes) TaxID=2820298 RepID=UPI0025EC4704|nr:ATPase domain-containing protein [Palaeococcus sp. (in: euryarchaeotes)]MCD6558665.1 hypothetical protein [Palaeococcus sp. (in: euryarchaeotes)]